MTLKQFKHSANVGYMRFYKLARKTKYVETRCKASLYLTGFLNGLREMGIDDTEISSDKFDELLNYCGMLEERFEKRFDL